MKNILFTIVIFCALFLNTNAAVALLGFKQMLLTAYSPILIYIGIEIFSQRINWSSPANRMAKFILILAVFIIILKFCLGQNYVKSVAYFLIIPMLISILLETISTKKRKVLRNLVLAFFLLECGLAIFEQQAHINLFDIKELTEEEILYASYESWEFRSTALAGHPLQNAMLTITIMSFILVSDFKMWTKVFFFTLGYIALLCFNARGAIIIATLFMVPYFLKQVWNAKIRGKWALKLGFAAIVLYIIHLVATTSLGGRLFNQGTILDGSAQTRLDVFEFYKYIDWQAIMWGNPDNYAYLMNKLGAGGVENGVIVLVIYYGLFLTLFILPALFCFQYKKLSIYPRFERLWLLAIFYLLGAMNPNLATPLIWIIWILAYYAFKAPYMPQSIKYHIK